jgi:hypothetical protein
MTVTFLLRTTCPLCGCAVRGWEFRTVRVNLRSLRSTDAAGLVWVDRACPECGWPTADQWHIAGLDPRDAPKVEAARAKLRARRRAA